MEAQNPLRFVSVSFVTNSLGVNDPKVGDTARSGDESYLWVYNAGNSVLTVGDGVIVSAVSGYSVTLSSLTGVHACVGVVRHTTIPTAYYGYVVTRGFTQINMGANNSAAAGDLILLGTDGKFGPKSISTGNPAPACGHAMAAIASGASGSAFINICGG